jgi:hypothetical protein
MTINIHCLFDSKKIVFGMVSLFLISGCVSTQTGPAMDTHAKEMGKITGNVYHIPKMPIDRAFLGYVWTKKHGPVKGDNYYPVRVSKEKSFSSIHQDFSHKALLSLGAKSAILPVGGGTGVEGEIVDKIKTSGTQILKPASLAEVPFELGLNFITEALRVEGFKLTANRSNRAEIEAAATTPLGGGGAKAGVGNRSSQGTAGEGLVIGYKIQAIDEKTYEKNTSGPKNLHLNRNIVLDASGVRVKAQFEKISFGEGKPLPNVMWACAKARGKKREMAAAWIVDVRYKKGRKTNSLKIGFPAHPQIPDCQDFTGFLGARIDPRTEKIVRKTLYINLNEATIDHFMNTDKWDAEIELEEETFDVTTVTPEELGK